MANEPRRSAFVDVVLEVGKTFIVQVQNAPGTTENYEVIKEFNLLVESDKIGLDFNVTQDEPHDTQMKLITHLIKEGFIKSKMAAH
jgi:hypothetical protein